MRGRSPGVGRLSSTEVGNDGDEDSVHSDSGTEQSGSAATEEKDEWNVLLDVTTSPVSYVQLLDDLNVILLATNLVRRRICSRAHIPVDEKTVR